MSKDKKQYYTTIRPLTDLRKQMRVITDDLSKEDFSWYLCRRTGRSYAELMSLLAEGGGNMPQFCKVIGYKRLDRSGNKYSDFGWWQTIAAWMRIFIPEWEKCFRETVTRLADPNTDIMLPDQQEILETVASALGLAPEMLLSFAQNLDTVETFLAANRRMLGVMAETKLWTLVAQGDAATIRWLLPRIKSDAFGDRLADVAGDKPREIKIIEVE